MGNEQIEKTILQNCEKLSNHEARIVALEQITADIHRLATSVEVMATEQKSMGENIEQLMEKIDLVEHRPARIGAFIVTALVSAVITAIITFLFRLL